MSEQMTSNWNRSQRKMMGETGVSRISGVGNINNHDKFIKFSAIKTCYKEDLVSKLTFLILKNN